MLKPLNMPSAAHVLLVVALLGISISLATGQAGTNSTAAYSSIYEAGIK